jgi:hypothetical protein
LREKDFSFGQACDEIETCGFPRILYDLSVENIFLCPAMIMQPFKRLVERTKNYMSPSTSPAPSNASTSSERTDTTRDQEPDGARKKPGRKSSFKWTSGSSSPSSSHSPEPKPLKALLHWGDDVEGEDYVIPDYADFVIVPSQHVTPSPRRCNVAPSAFAAAHKAAFPKARRFPEVGLRAGEPQPESSLSSTTRKKEPSSEIRHGHFGHEDEAVGISRTNRLTRIIEQLEPEELAISRATSHKEYIPSPTTDAKGKAPLRRNRNLTLGIKVSREVHIISQPVPVLKKNSRT